MSGVNIQGLSIKFGANEVIKGLDLQVREGEFLVLLGPSGCGKSTLLHSIAGLIDVSGGRIEIGGQDMTDAEPSERGIGMVFQSYALYPTMTVEKNMSFGLRVAGTPKAEIARRVDKAAQMLQLTPLLQRKPAQLSGGQRQRVAIARALANDPAILIADEPTGNLDSRSGQELLAFLRAAVREHGQTIVMVTHDPTAASYADEVVFLADGRVVDELAAPTPASILYRMKTLARETS